MAMRIVHIEDIFYPEAGYQVNILSKYEVKEGHEVFIVTCPMEFWDEQRKEFWGDGNIDVRDQKYEQEAGAKVIRYPAIIKYSSRVLYKKGFYKFIRSLKPDILFIHAESSFVTLEYLLKIKKNEFPIVMDSHSLEMAAHNRFRHIFYSIYRKIFAPIIRKQELYVIRTQDDDFIINQMGIPACQSPFISFGSDLTVFHPDRIIYDSMRKTEGIDKKAFVVIVTGKLTDGKGGKLLAEAFEKRISDKRDIVLITVGTPTSDPYGELVSKILSRSENQVIRVPTQKYYDLARYYQCADLAVFARECSLSFFDAQACGLPVVFESNTVNEQRASYHNALVFSAGDKKSLREKVRYFAEMSEEEYQLYSDSARKFVEKYYNYETICKEYTRLMEHAVNKFHARKKRG